MDPTVLIVVVLTLGGSVVSLIYWYIYKMGRLPEEERPQREKPKSKAAVAPAPMISSDSSSDSESEPEKAPAPAPAAEPVRGGAVINGRWVPGKVFVSLDEGKEKKASRRRDRKTMAEAKDYVKRTGVVPGLRRKPGKAARAVTAEEAAALARFFTQWRLEHFKDVLEAAPFGIVTLKKLGALGDDELAAAGMAPLDVVRARKGLAAVVDGAGEAASSSTAAAPTEQSLMLFNEGVSMRQSSKAMQRAARTKVTAVTALTRGGGGKQRRGREYRVPGQRAEPLANGGGAAPPEGMTPGQAQVQLQRRTVGAEGSGKFGNVTAASSSAGNPNLPALLAARETGRANTATALSISSDDD